MISEVIEQQEIDIAKLRAEIERLQAQWHDSDPEKLFLENTSLKAEIEQLRSDLELRNQTALDRKEAIVKLEVDNERLRAAYDSRGGEMDSMRMVLAETQKWNEDRVAEVERLQALVNFADNLRTAQRAYMADRGNDEKGRAVAMAARRYDEARGGQVSRIIDEH